MAKSPAIEIMRNNVHNLNNLLHKMKENTLSALEQCKEDSELKELIARVLNDLNACEQIIKSTSNEEFPFTQEQSIDEELTIPGEDAVKPNVEEIIKILVVDDDPMALSITKKRLEALEYQVTCSSSSKDAIAKIQKKEEKYDVALIDVNMPDVSGLELARFLSDIETELPIVLCTGYNIKLSEEDMRKVGIECVMKKPILIHKIAEKIRRVLDAKRES